MGYHIRLYDGSMQYFSFKDLLDAEMSDVGLTHILWLLAELCGKRAADIKVFTGTEHNDAVAIWEGLRDKLIKFKEELTQ